MSPEVLGGRIPNLHFFGGELIDPVSHVGGRGGGGVRRGAELRRETGDGDRSGQYTSGATHEVTHGKKCACDWDWTSVSSHELFLFVKNLAGCHQRKQWNSRAG